MKKNESDGIPIRNYVPILLAMKTMCLLLFVCVSLAASPGYSQNELLSVKARGITLREAFRKIEQQSDYLIFYSDHFLDLERKVNVDHVNLPVKDLLTDLLDKTQLTYKLLEGNLIVIAPQDTPEKLSGRVMDASGDPMPGVTIRVKNTNRGTVSDADGKFTIDASQGETLVISCIGMETIEWSLGTDKFLEFKMLPTTGMLSEVTVVSTGYQTISRERSAGSFYIADATTVADRSSSMNILQRLDGLVPGLTINNAQLSRDQVLIRGLTSISAGRAPLYVVDGITYEDISFLNPQDVDQVSVLKDATAASIWGSRASNGVIVITTKKGKASDKIKLSYNGFFNFQGKPDLDYLPGLSSEQFIQAAREVFDPVAFPWVVASGYINTGSRGITPHEMILYNQHRGLITEAQANQRLDSLAGINNLGQISELWYRDAALTNHTVTLSGGGQVHTFYASMAATGTQSNRPGETNNTYKINLRQDLQLNKKLSLFLITDLTNNRNSNKRPINIENRFIPYQLFRGADGENLSIPYMKSLSDSTRLAYEQRSRINLDFNPLDEFNYGHSQGDNFFTRITTGGSFKIVDGLRFEGVYGLAKGKNKFTSYEDLKSYTVRSEIAQFTVAPTKESNPVYYLPTNGGHLTVRQSDENNWTLRNQLIYDKNWDYKHQLTLLAGQEAQERNFYQTTSKVRGYNELLMISGAVDYLALGSGVLNPVFANNVGRSILANEAMGLSEDIVRFVSYYTNAAYTLDMKYTFNASWRIDQSNLFGLDKAAQNKPVWSTGLKWVISGEGFMEAVSWLNHLSLRATYGITGNAPHPKTASSYDIVGPQGSNFLPGGVGLIIRTPANRKLTWESTETINLGLDFSLLSNTLSGSVDVYSKNTSDLIGNMPVNPLAGYATITGNLGSLSNKGIELLLRSRNLSVNGFNWTSTLILAYNENIVTNLKLQTPITTGNQKVTWQFLPDYPAFSIFGYQYAGLDELGDPQIYLADGSISKAPNISKPEDILHMGTYQPPLSGGFTNSFDYKGIGLTLNMVYQLGHVIRRPVETFSAGRLLTNLSNEFVDRWKQPGDETITNIPSYSNNPQVQSRRSYGYYSNADINVISGSFIKLRDITMSYSLPGKLISRMGAEQLRFSVQVSNLMLWKANEYGVDPEFIQAMPINQGSVTLGLNLVF